MQNENVESGPLSLPVRSLPGAVVGTAHQRFDSYN